MRVKAIVSAIILGLSGATLAQVSGSTDPKLGNAANDNMAVNANTSNGADPAANAADPGKP